MKGQYIELGPWMRLRCMTDPENIYLTTYRQDGLFVHRLCSLRILITLHQPRAGRWPTVYSSLCLSQSYSQYHTPSLNATTTTSTTTRWPPKFGTLMLRITGISRTQNRRFTSPRVSSSLPSSSTSSSWLRSMPPFGKSEDVRALLRRPLRLRSAQEKGILRPSFLSGGCLLQSWTSWGLFGVGTIFRSIRLTGQVASPWLRSQSLSHTGLHSWPGPSLIVSSILQFQFVFNWLAIIYT